MARNFCDARILLLAAAAAFVFIQMRLFVTQSEYADRLAAAVESENRCTSQMRSLIDQISVQQGKLVALEEQKKHQDEEFGQLKALVHDLERKGINQLFNTSKEPMVAVVIMACNRPDYLERTVQSILKYHNPVASKFPLFISQDGTNPDVKSKSLSYGQVQYMQGKIQIFSHLHITWFIDTAQHLQLEPVKPERPGEIIAYYKIANHYKWALDQLFGKYNFSHVIILEDDMEIAPDFFDYFEAAANLLEKDKTIMAVSSWNDNGQKQFVKDPEALYRSDFFPGLGWMLSKSIWDELSPKWPKAYWDDWLRLKENHKNRQFIRPEVCRTYNFGEHGSSMGQFFRQYLEPIKLNDVHVDWKSMDLSYLLEENFLKHFSSLVSNATLVQGTNVVLKAYNIDGDVRIQYKDQGEFEQIARQFGIFEEWKDGIPRTAYKGVVVFRWQTSRRIFLVGPDSRRQLGIKSL